MNVFQGLGLRVSEQKGVLSVSGAVPQQELSAGYRGRSRGD